MKAFLRGYDVLAAPTVQVAPFPVEHEWVTSINGITQDTYIDWLRSCSRITVTGHPAVSVPAGFTAAACPSACNWRAATGRTTVCCPLRGRSPGFSSQKPARLASLNFRDR